MSNRISRRVLCSLAIIAIMLAVSFQDHVNAQCSPGIFGCWGSWEIVMQVPKTVKEILNTSTGVNKGCDYPNEPPPITTCSTGAGTTQVINWNVSGSLTVPILQAASITIGGNVGGSTDYNYSANPGTTVSGFCQTCEAVTGLTYTSTYYILYCNCGRGVWKDGTVKKFEGEFTDAKNGLTPNPPCNPN